MASHSNYGVFSVRIVSLDYYMSPPIPDLDFCYSSFLGATVEEVPVIRIYGATPAGQKTCLHVHGALPYFYVPFPDDLLQSPEEGHAFIHALSGGIEKVLRHKSNSTSKRQHVHAWSLVRAKRLYGYYSSEELFVKVYLYHPLDIARAASLLLDGAVLGKSFQPYESHIPYLLQFLVDYSLYGMSHLHASIVKFRSPVPDCYSAASAKQKNYDTPATLSSPTSGKPKIWLSSTIPTTLVWPDSTSSHDSKNIKYIHLTRRQSLCGLEADASVDDIINVKTKIYTSLSQTRSDVRMVQSLVPIWEEECERSGIQEGAKQDDPNKPLPDDVLRSFMHGLDYDRTLSQLCIEISNFFPSKVHAVDGDEKLSKYIMSCSDISRKIEPVGDRGYGSPCDFYLVGGEEYRSRGTSSSLSFIKEDPKSPDTETLGLLSWLASSQAEDELDAGDELLHEAILSPLLPAKSYRAAFEIAHRDYEHASQKECQDILDSVEGIVKSKGPKEQSAFSSQDLILDSLQGILKSEGSKEQASSAFQDHFDTVSSGSSIPQVDGSFDNNCQTPEKGNISETNMSYGEEKATAEAVGKGASIGSKSNGNKLLWGTLPFSVSECEPEASVLFCHVSSCDKMINDGFYDPSFHSKEGSCYDLKNDIAICSEKGGKALTLCSVRDLMRKKRCLRVEQAEAEVQKNEGMTPCWNEGMAPGQTEELTSDAYDRGSFHSAPAEEPSLQQSASHQNVHGSVACSTICSSGFQGTEGLECRLSCYSPTIQKSVSSLMTDMVQSRIVASDLVGFNQASTMKEQIKIYRSSMKLAAGDLSMPENESNKLYTTFSGVCKVEGPSNPPTIMKHHSTNQKEKSAQNEVLKSLTHANCNAGFVENMYAIKDDGDIAHGLLPKMHPGSCQQFTHVLDDDSRDFCKEKTSQEFIKMTFVSKPPINEHIHGPEETSVADQPDGNIDKRPGMEAILPFFPTHFQGTDSFDKNVSWSTDYALGVPTHFQNDGTVLYLLTHALSPPTFNSLNDWLLGGIKQHCLLDETGASKVCLDTCSGVVNKGAACCPTSPPIKVGRLEYDASQSSEEICSLEPEKFHPNICHFSSEPKLGICPAKDKVITDHLHDLSQISGPEKYENSHPTPLSQIGFRDPANIGGGQQLTLISMELLAESRGDLTPDPKFDAINVLSLVVQEDASNLLQVYVLLRAFDEKPGEKNGYGVSDCNLFLFPEERLLLEHFVEIISSLDPDILMGWEIQSGSLGYLAERALHLGMNLLKKISRTPFHDPRDKLKDSGCPELSNVLPDVSTTKIVLEDSAIEDEWGRNHASGVHVGGRIVLNIWRLMRSELKLNLYKAEAVAERVLRLKIPLFSNGVLNQWYLSGLGAARYKCIEYVVHRAKLNIQIMDQLDLINRTSELARVFGIDFFSVISRGSQYRVESMLLRLAHTQNYLAISPGYQQVASQPAMECLPLVMEPESGFYIDPVVVLDFQSLYPSMIIAYNLCYCSCLGNVIPSRANILGVSSYSPDIEILKDLREKLLLTPNGVMYVPSKVRKGILPRLLEEILSTRVMVKQAMKKLTSSQQVLHRMLNARQLALKLIANVTYGYTAAGFSGRMPCAEIADSIVQCGRRTLETAISFVNQHEKWKAKVIYGDTDSMFVLLKGRSKEDAFRIGHEIAYAITTMNPYPVMLKMEKVYQPCFLLTKKRYVGYSYEKPEQEKPTFDAKGIETVRRDTCPAVAKILERSIRLMFESQNLSEVKSYLQRQWSRILSGKISLNDFVFAKEVRLGTYSSRAASLPPAAIVAMKDMQFDPRAEPSYGERVPYVVIHGEPGSRLMDMVVNPFEILDINSAYRLNDLYYINKQIIPALQRVFGLLGADVKQWFSEIPRPTRPMLAKQRTPTFIVGPAHDDDTDNPVVCKKPQAKRSRIDTYYSSKHCTLCGELIHSSDYFCAKCSKKESLVSATVVGKTSKKERQMKHLAEICGHCGGGDWIVESGVKCISLACSVFYERRKAQKELLVLSSFAKAVGLYPSCNAELF